MRILDQEPDLNHVDTSALVDIGLTGSDSIRQRYNAMVNIPIVSDTLAVRRAVGFYRHEEAISTMSATGVHNSNTLVDYGVASLCCGSRPIDCRSGYSAPMRTAILRIRH